MLGQAIMLKPEQIGRHFPQDITQCIEAETTLPPFRRQYYWMHFLEWNVWISLKSSLKFVLSANKIPRIF